MEEGFIVKYDILLSLSEIVLATRIALRLYYSSKVYASEL